MATTPPGPNHLNAKAYIITGPTSGIGRATAFELARHGVVILVGRDRAKLGALQAILRQQGGRAEVVPCDLSDMASVQNAAAEIAALGCPIAGLLNNAGMLQQEPTKNAMGWDMTFATNHLGPFALTEALTPILPDGANVVFVASTVEDPEASPGKFVGYRGGRYISAEASAHGAWLGGGARLPGADAYATSKQCNLATAMAFARETPRLRFNAVTPGLIPTTGLFGRSDGGAVSNYLVRALTPLFMPFMRFLRSPEHAARVITTILTASSDQTGVYYDERGRPMAGSTRVRDQAFQDLVVAETRALLAVRPALPSPDATA
jgi:NAD(P)-dependent dehydrogenase (short-subunit alcohol dehydrogenase family)